MQAPSGVTCSYQASRRILARKMCSNGYPRLTHPLPYPRLLKANPGAIQSSVLRIVSELRRGEFLAGFFLLACVNGFASRIIQSVSQLGWQEALFNTFDISVIVWFSCATGVFLVFRDRTLGVSSLELALGLGCVILVVLPIGALSWVAVTGFGLLIFLTSDVSSTRRGAIILLAMTVPMLWSRMLFKFFANVILGIDASLTSWMLGTHRTGSVVEFADHSGQLVIFPACSSLANVSLGFLSWVTLSQLVCHKKSVFDLLWCLLVCASVVAVNVARLTVLGFSQWNYAAFHKGADVATNLIILGLIVGISSLGLRHELFSRN
jgi:hypothetical protein